MGKKEDPRRELSKEVDLKVNDERAHVESNGFVADDGDLAIDVLFLCQHRCGTPTAIDPGEVAAVQWMTAERILGHPRTPEWTRQSIGSAEKDARQEAGVRGRNVDESTETVLAALRHGKAFARGDGGLSGKDGLGPPQVRDTGHLVLHWRCD